MKAGVKGQGVGFLFTDNQIVQERFLVGFVLIDTKRLAPLSVGSQSSSGPVVFKPAVCILSLAWVNTVD